MKRSEPEICTTVTPFKFKVGDRVDKPEGYAFPGTVIAAFLTLTNQDRYVVEMDNYHLLHIFNGKQLKKT